MSFLHPEMQQKRQIKLVLGGVAFLSSLALLANYFNSKMEKSSDDEQQEKFMTPEELEKNLNITGSSIFTGPVLATIEKKEYSFYKNYLDAKVNPEGVRENLIFVLRAVNQDWCLKYYLTLLNDRSYSIRMLAAKGISLLERPETPKVLTKEIRRLYLEGHELRPQIVRPLVLAIGNTRDSSVLDELLEVFQQEKTLSLQPGYRDEDLMLAFQRASAKLGYPKTIREIELELISDKPFKRYKALSKVNYINDPAWKTKVIPLLMDEEIGWSVPMGPNKLRQRVCDHAVLVLRKLDDSSKINLAELMPGQQYNDEEMEEVRNAYGLFKK